MADGRKNNGGKRPGAGRKPKRDEIKLIEKLDKLIDPDVALKKLNQLVLEGDMQAIKLYMGYRYGQPKQSIDLSADLNIQGITFNE